MIYLRKLSIIIILFGSLWAHTFSSEETYNTCIEERLLEFFTKWRQSDDPSFPLPPLKLISIPSYEGQYAGYGLSLTFTTGDMKLVGVDGFTVEALSASASDVFNASGIFQFPLLTLTSDNYNIKGRALSLYSLKGEGAMRIYFDNVRTPFSINLGPNGEGSQIDDLRLNFTLDDVRVDLANSSWPINRILNAEGSEILNSYRSDIVCLAQTSLKYILNEYIKDMSPKQLLSTFIANCADVNIV